MASWSNWSGKITASPSEIIRARDESEVVASVRRAAAEGRCIRAQGAAHSHFPLVATGDFLIDMDSLKGIVDVDVAKSEATILAGTRISELGVPLRERGLALQNQGDIDLQSLAGAIATGTHGTGPTLQNLSASVLGVRMVLASGEVVECDPFREPELFQVARLSLGAIGIATEVRVSLRKAYRLREKMWLEDLDAVLDRIDELATDTRHFEFFWLPGHDQTACKSLTETQDEPQYPLASEGSRVGWSYEVLANLREDKHTEMEYSIPAERGADCIRALRELIGRDFKDLAWPIEYRSLAADDVWLSTAYQRPTVTISVHQGVDADEEPVFRACEEIFRGYEGRPHWGKLHYRSGSELASLHPRWEDWWRVRDANDAEGRFLNDSLLGFHG